MTFDPARYSRSQSRICDWHGYGASDIRKKTPTQAATVPGNCLDLEGQENKRTTTRAVRKTGLPTFAVPGCVLRAAGVELSIKMQDN